MKVMHLNEGVCVCGEGMDGNLRRMQRRIYHDKKAVLKNMQDTKQCVRTQDGYCIVTALPLHHRITLKKESD